MDRTADAQPIERVAFKQDALRAWGDYRRTGLYLAFEEADAWLAKLESGESAALPRCHG